MPHEPKPLPLAAAMAATHARRAAAGPGMDIALGWHRFPDGIVWHNGGTGGYASFVGFIKEKRTGVVLLANTAAYNLVTEAGRRLLHACVGLPAEPLKLPKTIPLTPEQLDACVGIYALAPNVTVAITRQGEQLFAQVTGQSACRIYPESPSRFFYKVADVQLTFTPDPAAAPMAALTIHQGGKDTPARRAPAPPQKQD